MAQDVDLKKLKCLNIIFETYDEFMHNVYKDLNNPEWNSIPSVDYISFDSYDTYKRLVTNNRLELLMTIARLKPESIKQLAKFVKREFPDVHKDCHALTTYGFVKLVEVEGARKEFMPCLAFDYDVIRDCTN